MDLALLNLQTFHFLTDYLYALLRTGTTTLLLCIEEEQNGYAKP